MDTNDFEIFRRVTYSPFVNKGRTFQLSNYPYLDVVMNDHCNARCKFCIGHLVHKKQMLDIEVAKKKIEFAVKNLGVREVLLLGGEATINKDLPEFINWLQWHGLEKICLTTNGHKFVQDPVFLEKLCMEGLTHLNLSLMSLDREKQKHISGADVYIGLKELEDFYTECDTYQLQFRINNNVFRGNNDTPEEMLKFYDAVKPYCNSVKFSPLLKTDSFSTVNEVTEWNRQNILSDEKYDDLWNFVENSFPGAAVVRNKATFGFVEYSMVMLDVPIILNYNQHGQMKKKVVEEGKINNVKLLPTGELSLSWNREEHEYLIDTQE